MALFALRQGNIGIGVLQEMELTGVIHTRQISGYTVWVTEEESRQWGEDHHRLEGSGWMGG